MAGEIGELGIRSGGCYALRRTWQTMKILLTNDDGIEAPGIAALAKAVDGELYVAAPDEQKSECGHQVTTRSGVTVSERSQGSMAVGGTPADCVRLALRGGLFQGVTFDWVLSGINEGGNLGVDIHISGTVAAAREAAILGHRSVAFSHYVRAGKSVDWSLASMLVARVFKELQGRPYPEKGFWNVNLPHGEAGEEAVALRFCAPCRNPLPVSYRREGSDFRYNGVYAERQGEKASDVSFCFGGDVSISSVPL